MHVQEAIPERVATFNQRTPGLVPADAIDADSALRLELPDSRAGLLSETPIERDRITTLREALLEVTHGVAVIADPEESVGRAQPMNLK